MGNADGGGSKAERAGDGFKDFYNFADKVSNKGGEYFSIQ